MPEASQAQEWVEVASYTSLVEAEAAASALEAAEIDVDLRNAAAVSTMPHMANAFGGVGLCVPAVDAAQAREILSSYASTPPDEAAAPGDGSPAEPTGQDAHTLAALRAWRAAILGLFFVPVLLHLLSLWNLIGFARIPGPAPRKARWMAAGALATDVVVLALVAVGWYVIAHVRRYVA